MNYKTICVLAGLVVWLGWTIAIRTFGQFFFLTDNPSVIIVLFVASFVLLVFLARLIFRLLSLLVQQVFLAAILLVAPGMVLDSLVMSFYGVVFPNLPLASASLYGGWLLLAYGAVLVGALTWPLGRGR